VSTVEVFVVEVFVVEVGAEGVKEHKSLGTL
jgi:hypothetical protein